MSKRIRPLGLSEIAIRAGVSYQTIRTYRLQGWPLGNPLPDADFDVSGNPMWWPETVDKWMAKRGHR